MRAREEFHRADRHRAALLDAPELAFRNSRDVSLTFLVSGDGAESRELPQRSILSTPYITQFYTVHVRLTHKIVAGRNYLNRFDLRIFREIDERLKDER